MNTPSTDYYAQLILLGSNAAFFRDTLKKTRQLHWHFAGKSEAFTFAIEAAIQEVSHKLQDANRAANLAHDHNDWRRLNRAQGLAVGLKEVLGLAEIALAEPCGRPAG